MLNIDMGAGDRVSLQFLQYDENVQDGDTHVVTGLIVRGDGELEVFYCETADDAKGGKQTLSLRVLVNLARICEE